MTAIQNVDLSIEGEQEENTAKGVNFTSENATLKEIGKLILNKKLIN